MAAVAKSGNIWEKGRAARFRSKRAAKCFAALGQAFLTRVRHN